MNTKITTISDESLYNLCKEYGERTRMWRQRFAGLLPEVFKRKLYEKKGFISIFEFAKKLAGMSEEQVKLAINLEKRFEETPALKSLLIEGKVSINKLARIVSIAKPENEMFLALQVQVLSKSAVETLVRDEKFAIKNEENSEVKMEDFDNQNGLQKSFFDPKSLPGQDSFGIKNSKSNDDKNHKFDSLNISPEVQEKLLELQQKGIDISDLLLEFLKKREEEIAQKKEKISQKISEREQERPTTRHIPMSVKRILHEEHGTKCSIKNCQKPSQQIHHILRFSAVQSHDPHYLAPLCKEHHELAHSGGNSSDDRTSKTFSADLAYCEIKQKAK